MVTTIDTDQKDAVTTYPQPTAVPTSKVAAVGIAGTLTTILVFILGYFNVVVPPEVVAALVTLVTFAAGYLKKSDTANGAVKEL